MALDASVLVEALTALTGVTVKLQSDCLDLDNAIKLDVTNLPTLALLGSEALGLKDTPASCWNALLGCCISDNNSQNSDKNSNSKSPSTSVPDSGQTSRKTPKKKSGSKSLCKELFVIPEEFFDPQYDCDFTHKHKSKSDSKCTRGDEPYIRPYGWNRFALKVKDKYPDGNAWLGTEGWRNHSVSGEWPVSYHGTNLQGAEGIIKTHYKAGDRAVYGKGIYSSPDITVAESYATSKAFTSKKNGKTYKVIMQNRVHPQKREIIKKMNYWLVPIPKGTSAERQKEIVESAIRPYGLLLKEV